LLGGFLLKTCKQCGVTLGDHAYYYMQCGTPVELAVARSSEETTADFIQPALVGGAALGVLSSIPFVNAGNCICCMWVIGGGALAAWMLTRQRPADAPSVSYGDGAFVGVLSGLFGAIIATLLSLPFRLLAADALRSRREEFETLLNDFPELTGFMRDLLIRLVSPEISFVTVLATFFVNLLTFSLFAMIGGILFVAITGQKGLDRSGIASPGPRT